MIKVAACMALATALNIAPATANGALTRPEPAPVLPEPSGETCAEKVSFYLKHGAIWTGKISVSECSARNRGRELLGSLQAIEEASKFANKNPLGTVRMAVSESRLIPTENDYETGRHKGLFQIGTYNVRAWSTGLRTMAVRKHRAEKKRNPKAKMVKIDANLHNPRTNAYLAVWAINEYGTGPWEASIDHWLPMRRYIDGDRSRYSDYLALAPVMYSSNAVSSYGNSPNFNKIDPRVQ